jgi:hypothetical protein
MSAVLFVRALPFLALTALAGCGDHITAPAPAADDGLNPAAVTAAAAPVRSVEIRKLSMGSKKLIFDGTPVSYTVTVRNPGPDLSEVFLQAMVLQGGAYRGAGGVNANCGAGDAVLPSGTCSIEWTAGADNGNPGDGTLVPGPAEFVLTLSQGFTTPVVLDEVRARIVLVAP